MSDINDEVVQMLAKYIVEAVKHQITQAPFDRIVDGVITSVNNNIYTVTISGGVYNISDVNTHNINEKVKIVIPQNDNDRMFILSLTGSGEVNPDSMLKSIFATNLKAEQGYVDKAINSETVGGKSIADFTPVSHVGMTGSAHGIVTTNVNGFMSSSDKIKIDNISSGANKIETSLLNGNIKIDGTEKNVYTHPTGTNPHGTTKADVDLGNVDNTSDVNKPISSAVLNALNSKLNTTSNAVSASKISESDTRNTNETPQWYMTTHGKSNVYEFKTNTIIGLTTAFSEVSTYSEVSTFVSWGDLSGGYPVQLAVNNTGMYFRYGISNTTWGAWNKIVKTTDIPTSLPASGGNADTVNGHSVNIDIPANAVFTDTITTINGKTGVIAKSDITALGIPAQDTIYTHPANHSADIIIDGTTNKNFTAIEKTKLAGIASGAEVNVQSDWNATSGDALILNKPTNVSGYGITDVYTKNEIDNKVSAVYKYKGSVSTYASLPTTNRIIGDVWNVTDTGINYAWDGTVWDDIGGIEALATAINNGLMSKEDFLKLSNIEAGANKYTHPLSHNATMITEDTTHKFVTDAEKIIWNGKLDSTIYTANDILVKIKTVDGSGSGIDVDLLDGKHASEFALINGVSTHWKTGKIVHNVINCLINTTPTEILIKTGIPFISAAHMPVIHIQGYAYGLQSPIELKIGYYVYGGQHGWCGAVSMGAWKPTIKLFTYLVGTDKYTGVALLGSIYYPQFSVNVQTEMGGIYETGWSIEHNGANSSISIIPTTDVVVVPYKSTFSSKINNVVYNGLTDISITAPANGGNADTVGGHTVGKDVPADAIFTDTITTVNGKTGVISKADIVALGIPAQDNDTITTVNGKSGIISKSDIVALGIPAQDTVYALPVAGISLGGIKNGTDITVDASGNVTVNDDSHNHIISNIDGLQSALDGKVDDSQVLTNVPINAIFTDTITTVNGKTGAISKSDIVALGIPSQDTVYNLPIASTILGGVKSGTDITVDVNGNVSVNDDSHNHTIGNVDGLQSALDGKVDDSQVLTNVPINAVFTDTVTTVNGKTGTIAKSDIVALGIPAQDTLYTHPEFHPATIITEDTTHKFTTDTEKNTWNGKQSQISSGTTVPTGGVDGDVYFKV
jgi:hypothetical protein